MFCSKQITFYKSLNITVKWPNNVILSFLGCSKLIFTMEPVRCLLVGVRVVVIAKLLWSPRGSPPAHARACSLGHRRVGLSESPEAVAAASTLPSGHSGADEVGQRLESEQHGQSLKWAKKYLMIEGHSYKKYKIITKLDEHPTIITTGVTATAVGMILKQSRWFEIYSNV